MKKPIDAILSNCRIFLDKKNQDNEILENVLIKKNVSEKDIRIARSKVADINAFDIVKVLSVALAKNDLLELLVTWKDAAYNQVDDTIYKMACRNLASQIRQDAYLKRQILRLRSDKKIKECEDQILGLDAFAMSQVLSIAFLKDSPQIVLDISEEQNNLSELY